MEGERFLKRLAKGEDNCTEIQIRCVKGLKNIKCPEKGLIRCSYTVPDLVTRWKLGSGCHGDVDGYSRWLRHILSNPYVVTSELAVSHLSTAKTNEEVEMEAKVVGHRGKLPLISVEVRRKANGELIAVAKQWVAPIKNGSKL
ncbi:Thioesterase domain [Dillenia turbinata]|uniref:Thioesterase domain n=1 Tax=Dillenia turbinata TaxID=194707 RepID=A0AAN8YR12_9MAGN